MVSATAMLTAPSHDIHINTRSINGSGITSTAYQNPQKLVINRCVVTLDEPGSSGLSQCVVLLFG